MNLRSHFYSIWPTLRHAVARESEPRAEPFRVEVPDAVHGTVALSGWLADVPGSDTLVVIVHGLGGNASRFYCARAARAASAAGVASLRLALRGADLSGEDIYHSALASDVEAALASPAVARFRRVLLLGYSIGGHVALHAAVRAADPRVRAAAAVCAPLDLARSGAFMDSPRGWFYRSHVLRGLKRMYEAVARRRDVPTDLATVRRARTFRAWDARTVVPRFGFGTVERYYAEASVGPRLPELRVPSLWIGDAADPVVPLSTVEPWLEPRPSPLLHVRRVRGGGHVAFPAAFDAGLGGPPGLETQVVSWLLSHAAVAPPGSR